MELQAGDVVVHPSIGFGKVLAVSTEHHEIKFRDGTIRKFAAWFQGIRKADASDIDAPPPDAVINGVDHWECPHCHELNSIEAYGWRKRDDVYPGQDVYHKQSWCAACRFPTPATALAVLSANA